MRQGAAGRMVLMALLTAGLLAYFGVEAYRYFADPFTTALAYPYEVEDTVELTGWVVREEQVLPAGTEPFVRTERAEGERVSRGGVAALAYRSQEDLDRQTELETTEDWLEQLRYARESALSAELSVRLDTRIFQSLTDYRASLSSDRLARAGEQGAQLKSLIVRRDFIPTGLDELDARIAQTEERLAELRRATPPAVRTVRSPASGLYSGAVDGYERALTPSMLESLKPSQLDSIEPQEASGLGRLILGDTWYYAAALSTSAAGRLERYLGAENGLNLRFTRSLERDFPVTLTRLGWEEDGRMAAVFESRKNLSEVTLLRRQSAQAVLGAVEGLRVPTEALRLQTEEDGTQVSGLYCVVGTLARFKPVEVLYTGDNFLLVKSTIPEAAVTDALESVRLRAGDEVIVRARDLYDQKVIIGGSDGYSVQNAQ